ncbi:hypothetical protein HELRODRAFT_77423 [Helobdella robusta]|uniref:Out at first protein n=1 Tax=Helobdella robusta TaxID=6412 RepID=T1G2X5_HELRO|nr:hypothetical protein HELRODRAFT_77423 [Helobdella robusta]ESO05785.1 hypothetical protein HELRODRAFT_77423 [Helobdella robusta]
MFCRILFCCTLYLFFSANSQLIINAKNKGGDVFKEFIEANTTYDTISLDFMTADGTLVTHFVDSKNELQIFKLSLLPEDDLFQTGVINFCFVTRITKNEFISSDAMSKLRQKNPSAMRHPEEQLPTSIYTMDVMLNARASHLLSPHINSLCKTAKYSTFAEQADIKLLAQIMNKNYSLLEESMKKLPDINGNHSACSHTSTETSPCICHLTVCVEWYPCGLKYCRGRDSQSRVLNYRCGIKTCKKCSVFKHYVSSFLMCTWDEPKIVS